MADIQIIEKSGQRVLTTSQIAEAFGTDVKVISKNFTRNKDRYTIGKHYFLLTGDELKAFKTIHQNDEQFKHVTAVYLWTEKGAWLHAKSLSTDQAWDAYRGLVDNYYDVKDVVSAGGRTLSKDESLVTVLRATADLFEGQKEIKHIVAEHDYELKELRDMVQNQITLDHGEQRTLQRAVARKVYEFASEPKERRELFPQLQREIKDRWGVASYRDVPRVELANVLKYVDAWRPRVMVVV